MQTSSSSALSISTRRWRPSQPREGQSHGACAGGSFSALITDRRDIPLPSPAGGRKAVYPSLLGSLKVSVYRAMRERGWRKADLARAMALNPRQIDRLLDLRRHSTIAQLEQALRVCGKGVEVNLRELETAA